MTNEELHEILDDPKREITREEALQILYEIRNDACGELGKDIPIETLRWYCGEINGIQIALDLLEKMK